MSTTTTAARARTVTWQAGNIRLKRDDSPWNLYNLLDGVSAKTPIDRTYLVEPVDASFASGSLTLTAHRVRITVGDDAEQWTVHREQKLRTLVLDAPVILLNPPTEDAVDAADRPPPREGLSGTPSSRWSRAAGPRSPCRRSTTPEQATLGRSCCVSPGRGRQDDAGDGADSPGGGAGRRSGGVLGAGGTRRAEWVADAHGDRHRHGDRDGDGDGEGEGGEGDGESATAGPGSRSTP